MGDHGAGHLSRSPQLFELNPVSGRFDLHLGKDDIRLLRQLGPQMVDLLSDPGNPNLYRLFPPAYSDPAHIEAQEEYRRLMQEDLVERQKEQMELLATTAGESSLSEEQLMGWTRAINSIRLVLGTVLGVSEDDEDKMPRSPDEALYMWLGLLVSEAIDALSGQT